MKKLSIKKILALGLVLALVIPFAVGCSLVVYNEDRDMQQVVLRVESFEMEYNVPFYVQYKNSSGKKINYEDGTPVMTVQRDEEGNPIHKPVVENGKVVYQTEEGWTGDVFEKTSKEYFISYTISGSEATAATVYRYEGIENGTKLATWRNTDTGDVVKSDTVENPETTKLAHGTKYADLPTIYFSAKTGESGYSWYYLTAEPKYVTDTYMTAAEEYTKQELINYYNRSVSQFEGQNLTLELQFKTVMRGLYTLELMYLEAEKYIKSGEVEWGLTQQNNVTKSFYNAVDSELKSLFNDIYGDHDEEFSGETSSDSDSSSTTYPVPESTAGTEKDEYVWAPDKEYLGLGTSSDRSSLVREAIRRWISSLTDVIEDDNTISNSERAVYEAELAQLKKLSLSQETLVQIYPNLLSKNEDGTYKYSVMWYLYGESNDRNQKASALQSYIESTADTSENTVYKRYQDQLKEQRSIFSVNTSSYHSAVTGDSTILYYADDEYFFVKHILLPFPADVSANLTKYKESGKYSDISYNEMRERVAPLNDATAYPVYPHVDGEDDKDNPTTVQRAYDEILQAVNSKATVAEKEQAFESMIFKYNTDPGIFNNDKGYAVSKTPAKDGGPDETYVIEFATAARELRANKSVGAVSKPVLGDYGYHILYLLKVPGTGTTMGYNEKITEGSSKTVKDLLTTDISNETYATWSNGRASFYEWNNGEEETSNGVYFSIFKNTYKDLYENK